MAPRVLTAAIGALAVLGALAGASGAGQAPRTLVTFHGEAVALAISGERIAWTDSVFRVYVERDADRRVTRRSYDRQYSAYDHDSRIVFAAGNPAWLSAHGGNFKPIVQTAWSLADGGLPRRLAQVRYEEASGGVFLTGIAGSPAGGAIGVARLNDLEPRDCFCRFVLAGGGVWTFDRGAAHRVAGLPPPALLTRFGDRVALVRVESRVQATPRLDPAPGAPVEIRSLDDASTITTFTTDGPAHELVMTDRFVFALVGSGAATQLEVHDPTSGTLLRTLRTDGLRYPRSRVSPDFGPPRPFAAAGRWGVFGSPHAVWIADGATGSVTAIAHAGARIGDVTTDGRTVAWVELHRTPGGFDRVPRLQWLSRIRAQSLVSSR